MSIFGRALVARRGMDAFSGWTPYLDGTIPPNSYAADGGGMPVTEQSAMHLVDAYSCVTLISDALSTLPFGGFSGVGATRTPIVRSFFDQPDPELSQGEFIAQVGDSLAVRGEAGVAFTAYDRLGWPVNGKAIHPDDFEPKRARTGEIVYELRNGQTLTRREFMHIKLHPTAGSLRGRSPIDHARRSIRMAINTEQFGDMWFRDGAAPSSVLETDEGLDDDDARAIQAKWIASHGGRRRPAVLTGGLKWRPVTITPNESQFLETRKLNTSQIARIWRVPPHMIGDTEKSTSWGTGIEQQGIGFVVYTLGVYLSRIEQAFALYSPRGTYARFNVNSLLRGDAKARFDAYAVGRQWGWLSVNDIRSLEDLPPVDGGDTYLQPLNMVDAEKALTAQKLAPPDAPTDGGAP